MLKVGVAVHVKVLRKCGSRLTCKEGLRLPRGAAVAVGDMVGIGTEITRKRTRSRKREGYPVLRGDARRPRGG